MKPLRSLKVLDLTDGNPYIGSMFADYGAEVLKIETPGAGDSIRRRGASGEEGIYQAYYNRGKRSMTLNLSEPRGQEILRKLLPLYDMLAVNRSEEAMAELGFSYEEVKAVNPKMIYGVLTPFGEEGPWKDLPDYDLLVMARTGLLEKTGMPEKPTKFGFPLGYFYSSWHLTAGMLAAYWKAMETGEGQKVSTSTWHVMMELDDTFAECLLGMNTLPKRIGNGFPTTNPTDTFRCRDGWFSLSIGSDAQWIAFAQTAGREDWATDPRYAHDPARSMENYFGDLDGQLKEFFAGITIAEADRICREAMVPGGPCNTVRELVSDAQVADRKMLIHVKDKRLGDTLQVGMPAKFFGGEEDEVEITSAPALGEDNETMLAQLQIPETEIAELKEKGII